MQQKTTEEILSQAECQKLAVRFDLSEEQLKALKSSLIGLVDNILNHYFESFR